MERGLLREHEYDAERAERARARGSLSRRGLLKAGLAGLGVAAVGGGLATSPGALGTALRETFLTGAPTPLPVLVLLIWAAAAWAGAVRWFRWS